MASNEQPKKESRIPEFSSYEEEAEFWDTHSLADYWDEFKPIKLKVGKKLSEPVTLSLDLHTLRRVRALAKAKRWPMTNLIYLWILEGLERESPESDSSPTADAPPKSAAKTRQNKNSVAFGPLSKPLQLEREELTRIIKRGHERVERGVNAGLLAWRPEESSKRYALFVAFGGVGQPITDAQCRDLAGVVYGIMHSRGSEDWEDLKYEGRALSIRWAATSNINSNPNRGFVVEQGDSFVCPLW